MKYLNGFVTTLALFLSFTFSQAALSQTTSAPDFTGTYHDQEGDVHSFEMQADGTLLGKLTVDDTVFDVPFELDAGQAYGFLRLEDGTILGIVLTIKSVEALTVQVVPMDTNNQPVLEQLQTYTFTRESITLPPTLATKTGTQNPLTTQPTINPLSTVNPNSSGVPIQANQTYEAGTTLVSSAAGFSLTVPVGHIASYTMTETGQGALSIGNQKDSTLIVIGLSKADLLSLTDSSLESLGNLELIPVGTPQQTSDMFRATFQANANGTPTTIYVAGKQGAAGNAVVMLGFAVPGQDASLAQAVDSTLASLQFTQPTAHQAFSLGGIELNADDGSSTSNSSGDAHLSGIREEHYVFCSSGEYLYEMQETTMFSGGDFGDFSSEESDQHQGHYEVVSATLGEPYLLLQALDRRHFLHPISQSANGVMVGEASFSITRSSQCQ